MFSEHNSGTPIVQRRATAILAILLLVSTTVAGYFFLKRSGITTQTISTFFGVPTATPTLERYRDARTGVELIFIPETDMFPESWIQPPVSGSATAISVDEIARSLSIVTQSLNKYPADIFPANLRKIYLVKQLSFFGTYYGGTATAELGGRIYIVNDGIARGYHDAGLEWAFHSELSSILRYNYPQYFDEAAWLAVNPPDFQYRSSGAEALKEGTSANVLDQEYLRLGFLHQYATSNVEEDYNAIASHIWANIPEFWRAVDSYERIRRKTNLVIQFYSHIHPLFTESYFKSLPVVLPQ
ncbi:MAG: hypothetical protein AAB864_02465 [Patescibacteria group bacterium]